jgi:hypothetical protein
MVVEGKFTVTHGHSHSMVILAAWVHFPDGSDPMARAFTQQAVGMHASCARHYISRQENDTKKDRNTRD